MGEWMCKVTIKLTVLRVMAWFVAFFIGFFALANVALAQPLTGGVTFNYSDLPQANNAAPATLDSATVAGITYGQFIVPDVYRLSYDPALHSAGDIRFEAGGLRLSDYIATAGGNVAAGIAAFEADAIPRFQSRNLNRYTNIGTGAYGGNPPPVQSLRQRLTYATPINLRLGGFVVVTERDGSNVFFVTANGVGVAVNRGTRCGLGDYFDTLAKYDNGQCIAAAVIPLSSFGSAGIFDTLTLTCGNFAGSTNRDCGDGKVFTILETQELSITKTTGFQSPVRPDNTFDQTFTIEIGNIGTLNVVDLAILDDVKGSLGGPYDPASGLVSGPTVTLFESPDGTASMTGLVGNPAFECKAGHDSLYLSILCASSLT